MLLKPQILMFNSQRLLFALTLICLAAFTAYLMRPNDFDTNGALKVNSADRLALVSYKERLWWISTKGELLYSAEPESVLSMAFVSGVSVNDLKIDPAQLELIKSLREVIADDKIVEVDLQERCVVTVKGIVIYFDKWEDIIANLLSLDSAVSRMEPRSEYFLTANGVILKLRGGQIGTD